MRTSRFARSSLTVLFFATGLLAAASALAADPVYKWKDNQGHSHYSQTPPMDQKYETVTPANSPVPDATASDAPTPTDSTTPTVPAVPRSPRLAARQKNCDTAQSNVALLASHPTADIDAKGTGNPAPVTTEQRSAEIARANQQVAQFCTK